MSVSEMKPRLLTAFLSLVMIPGCDVDQSSFFGDPEPVSNVAGEYCVIHSFLVAGVGVSSCNNPGFLTLMQSGDDLSGTISIDLDVCSDEMITESVSGTVSDDGDMTLVIGSTGRMKEIAEGITGCRVDPVEPLRGVAREGIANPASLSLSTISMATCEGIAEPRSFQWSIGDVFDFHCE
jgi:hypothetical protein